MLLLPRILYLACIPRTSPRLRAVGGNRLYNVIIYTHTHIRIFRIRFVRATVAQWTRPSYMARTMCMPSSIVPGKRVYARKTPCRRTVSSGSGSRRRRLAYMHTYRRVFLRNSTEKKDTRHFIYTCPSPPPVYCCVLFAFPLCIVPALLILPTHHPPPPPPPLKTGRRRSYFNYTRTRKRTHVFGKISQSPARRATVVDARGKRMTRLYT